MLVIWSSAGSRALEKAFAWVLRSFRPDVPKHCFVPLIEGVVPDTNPGDVLLVCGFKAFSTLQQAKLAPKNRTVTSMRETRIKLPTGAEALVTFDPAIVSNEPDKGAIIAWDLQLAVRIMRTGSVKPVIGNYRWVNSFQPTIDWIEERFKKTGKPVDVSMDTETMTFYPWYPDRDIVSISFTAEPETAHALYLGPKTPPVPLDPAVPLFEQIVWLLNSPKVRLRGANLKYDLIWIGEKWGIECTNFKFDMMLVGSLLDENRSNSLSLLTKTLTTMGGYDLEFDANHDKGHMERAEPGPLLIYGGGDTDACQRVSDVLKTELLQDGELANFYVTILHPAARAFEKLERRGVLVDQQRFAVLRDDLKVVIAEQTKVALGLLPNKMRIKYRDRIEDQIKAGKNPLLPSILKEFFFTAHGLNLKPKEFTGKTKEPSMAKAHLRQFVDVPEAKEMLAALTEKDSAEKTLSTFVDGFLAHLRPDGRFHSTYFLGKGEFEGHEGEDGGTNTGRLSAKDPAFQVIPKKTKWAKRIRACFVAPPGKAILALDYSQGELRVVACVANETTMINAYEKGLDLHAVTGAKMGGVPLEEFLTWKDSTDTALTERYDDLRGKAKPCNFGLLYGMSAEGFQAYAWAAYGLRLSLDEATMMRNAFFELYTGLPDYHEHQRGLVRSHGFVRSPLGRVRHLPMIEAFDRSVRSKAERQAINSPIQSCLSDMMIWAIARIEEEYGDDIAVVGTIHDAMIAYVDADKLQLRAQQAREIMMSLPFEKVGWNPQLSFPADAEGSLLDLAHMEKLKF